MPKCYIPNSQQLEHTHTHHQKFKLSLIFIHLTKKKEKKTKSLNVFKIYTHSFGVWTLSGKFIDFFSFLVCLALICFTLLDFSSHLILFHYFVSLSIHFALKSNLKFNPFDFFNFIFFFFKSQSEIISNDSRTEWQW